jgi:hypothetical protein
VIRTFFHRSDIDPQRPSSSESMKTRIIAALLAVTALAGCDRGVLPLPQDVVGTWQTDTWTAMFPLRSGAAAGTLTEVWTFAADGTYGRHAEFHTDAGEAYTTYVESGAWTAKGPELRSTVFLAAESPAPLGQQPPEPRQIAPRTQRSDYTVAGSDLTLSPLCPADAICDGPPLVLHRVLFN